MAVVGVVVVVALVKGNEIEGESNEEVEVEGNEVEGKTKLNKFN